MELKRMVNSRGGGTASAPIEEVLVVVGDGEDLLVMPPTLPSRSGGAQGLRAHSGAV
ncbi:hypothetical protein GCM10010129_65490 [Streptomyces fumigatiscleroticus]|nr:hypothetical protein GCM10010129_65490 [Streptomyces fumigatiscleroticus]